MRAGGGRPPIDDKEPERAEIGRDWTKHYRIGSKFNARTASRSLSGALGVARTRSGDVGCDRRAVGYVTLIVYR